MQDICREAGVSPGALYVYFNSKEDLIAGIAERDRAKLVAELTAIGDMPDLLKALAALGEHYFVDQPDHKRVLHIEIGCEATRNAAVGEIFRAVDGHCHQSFERLFERAAAEGKINPGLDTKTLATVIALIGDGFFWRRAVDPSFDAKAMIPVVMQLVGTLLNPTTAGTNASEAVLTEAAQ